MLGRSRMKVGLHLELDRAVLSPHAMGVRPVLGLLRWKPYGPTRVPTRRPPHRDLLRGRTPPSPTHRPCCRAFRASTRGGRSFLQRRRRRLGTGKAKRARPNPLETSSQDSWPSSPKRLQKSSPHHAPTGSASGPARLGLLRGGADESLELSPKCWWARLQTATRRR